MTIGSIRHPASLFHILRVGLFGFRSYPILISIFQRNDFTRSFGLESVRKNLVWRYKHLWPPDPQSPLPAIHCLPHGIRDPYGRPMIFIQVAAFTDRADSLRPSIIRGFERLRIHLKNLNEGSDRQHILQYVMLLDLKNLSMQNLVS